MHGSTMLAPMISSPLKQTSEIDWVAPLKDYIRHTYGDDPERYAEECATLNRLRQDMRGAGKDSAAGRDLLYRYYGQLELLDLRFPVDENHIKISFTWFDAFTHKPTSQYSLAYEKASIIFNISAVLSCHAANQNRSEDGGLKTAYHSFQASAGMFTYINENFLHAPSTDLSRDTVKTLIAVMLAQGQEVFLEKQIADEKKYGLLAKLASQAAFLYSQAIEGVQENVTKAIFEKVWLLLVQVKSNYMASLAQYYQGLADNDANSHGVAIARLQVAESSAKDALRLANAFPHSMPANSNLGAETGATLVELTKRQLANVQDRWKEYTKDNDFIYHQLIPNDAALAVIPKLPAAKAIPVSELYAGQDISRIIGPDIFQKIVPIAVTESASLYDEEKAKLVRAEGERVDMADGEMAAGLDYLKLPGSLTVLKGGLDHGPVVDDEFRGWCEQLAGHDDAFDPAFDQLKTDKGAVQSLLERSLRQLDMEESVCEKMRSKYGPEWTQQPSARLTTTLRSDLRNYRDAVDQASGSDAQLFATFRQYEQDFDEMRSAGETDEAEVLFQRAMIKVGQGKGKGKHGASPVEGSLLDEDYGESGVTVMDQIERVEELLRKLTLVKRERAQVLKDLREKAQHDDISSMLILNKKSIANHEQQLFHAELEKFRPHQTRLQQAIHKQHSLMKELRATYGALLQDKRVRAEQSKYESLNRQRNAVLARYRRVYQAFHDLQAGLLKAQHFYSEMKETVDSLEKNVETFVGNRRLEGAQLLSQIERDRSDVAGGQAERERERLRELMERMSMEPPPSSAPIGAPPTTSGYALGPSHAYPGPAGGPSPPMAPRYPLAGQYPLPVSPPLHAAASPSSPAGYGPSFPPRPDYSQPPAFGVPAHHDLYHPGHGHHTRRPSHPTAAAAVSPPSTQPYFYAQPAPLTEYAYGGGYAGSGEYASPPLPPPPPPPPPPLLSYTQPQPSLSYNMNVPSGYEPPPPPPGPPPLGPQQTFPSAGALAQYASFAQGPALTSGPARAPSTPALPTPSAAAAGAGAMKADPWAGLKAWKDSTPRRELQLRPRWGLARPGSVASPFSTSPARRKDAPKDPDPARDEVAGVAEEDAEKPLVSEEEGVKPADGEDDVGPPKRNKGPDANEPAPIPPSAGHAAGSEDRAASAGGGSEKSSAGVSGGSSSGSTSGAGGDGAKRSRRGSAEQRSLSKPTVPEIYPQVMAIPIARRPLFPGFYKAVTIRDPNVVAAIQDMIKRGQPYIGAFLFQDENADHDVIEKMEDVHPVGVFAQITSAFPVHGEESSLTAVLYPHRRIRMSALIPPGHDPAAVAEAVVTGGDGPAQGDKAGGDVVASFEEGSIDHAPPRAGPATAPIYEPTAFLRKYDVSLADVENLTEDAHDKKSPLIRAVTSEIVNVFKEIANLNPLFRDQISTFSISQSAGNVIDEPAKLADFAAAVSAGETKELQEVLETLGVEERLTKALLVLKKELMNAQLQSKISKDVEAKIQKRQREYWLMEQMKGIKRELGIESDGKDRLVEKFKEKAARLAMPDGVQKVFEEEISKLAHLEPAASEFNVTRNYLDWLTAIPWGQRSTENFGIQHAMQVLDEDHYGLTDVKNRILEFIAVGKLRGTVEGKIICFVGPPGVGKTSIGKSIARALNRQYYRFSVGGLTDVAEIKGHRRTYVGALPGRIIQALKKCQTENPLVLIDEVDKIGRGHQGDPASALLELLDPEQNNSFLDHYMDVPVDLSKVLFVCTANMTDTIPQPLQDRMEMIKLSGYVGDEKMAIADKYLAPVAKEMSGLADVDVRLEPDALEELIKSYCRESGVRGLKKQIEKVYRKCALKVVREHGDGALSEAHAITDAGQAALHAADRERERDPTPAATDVRHTPDNMSAQTTEQPRVRLQVPAGVQIRIGKDNLKEYVGPPVYTSDRLYEVTPAGVAMGLAWTQMGGAALYVETILESALSASSAPGLDRTGNLKSVMKESTLIAYSFAKSFMVKRFAENRFFEKAKLHLHCPEGAVPKDGPSAGITMATSLLSLALDHPIDPTIAMTGELTVTGKVLRIGGLREKTVAAHRAGARTIIFPADNMSDWLKLPDNIKQDIEGHAASWYSDVFDHVFQGLDPARARNVWKSHLAADPK
ncbi:MAG: ATP-dependent Lon protease pim1 [Phylliscum demangeonii]|nr:MAG: ATP-dependent Lon protease pim1 [Phylliscum demangeonii]